MNVQFLTQSISKYGGHAIVRSDGVTSGDGLAHVIVTMDDDFEFGVPAVTRMPASEDGQSLTWYPQIVWLSMAACIPEDAVVVCIGEIFTRECEAFIEHFGDSIAALEINKKDSLIVYSVKSAAITTEMPCPIIHSDMGVRQFVFAASGTELEASLMQIHDAVKHGNPEALVMWHELRRRCNREPSIRELCSDAILCVIPDGPHGHHAGFYFAVAS